MRTLGTCHGRYLQEKISTECLIWLMTRPVTRRHLNIGCIFMRAWTEVDRKSMQRWHKKSSPALLFQYLIIYHLKWMYSSYFDQIFIFFLVIYFISRIIVVFPCEQNNLYSKFEYRWSQRFLDCSGFVSFLRTSFRKKCKIVTAMPYYVPFYHDIVKMLEETF